LKAKGLPLPILATDAICAPSHVAPPAEDLRGAESDSDDDDVYPALPEPGTAVGFLEDELKTARQQLKAESDCSQGLLETLQTTRTALEELQRQETNTAPLYIKKLEEANGLIRQHENTIKEQHDAMRQMMEQQRGYDSQIRTLTQQMADLKLVLPAACNEETKLQEENSVLRKRNFELENEVSEQNAMLERERNMLSDTLQSADRLQRETAADLEKHVLLMEQERVTASQQMSELVEAQQELATARNELQPYRDERGTAGRPSATSLASSQVSPLPPPGLASLLGMDPAIVGATRLPPRPASEFGETSGSSIPAHPAAIVGVAGWDQSSPDEREDPLVQEVSDALQLFFPPNPDREPTEQWARLALKAIPQGQSQEASLNYATDWVWKNLAWLREQNPNNQEEEQQEGAFGSETPLDQRERLLIMEEMMKDNLARAAAASSDSGGVPTVIPPLTFGHLPPAMPSWEEDAEFGAASRFKEEPPVVAVFRDKELEKLAAWVDEGGKEAAVPGSPAAEQQPLRPTASSLPYDDFYVFMCNNTTHRDCMRLQLFGSPAKELDKMSNSIGPKTALLLYNFDKKTIEGVYTATGAAAMNINRDAWGRRGAGSSYPAQIKVKADPNYKLGSALAIPLELSRARWGGSITDSKAVQWLKQQMLSASHHGRAPAGGVPAPGGGGRRPIVSHFKRRKAVDDILNKWIFRASSTGSTQGSAETDWHVAGKAIDPVIPSFVEQTALNQYIKQQLWPVRETLLPPGSSPATLDEHVHAMTKRFREHACNVLEFAEKRRRELPEDWTDTHVGLTRGRDRDEVVLKIHVQIGPSTIIKKEVRIWYQHLNELHDLHALNGGRQDRFFSRVFNVLMRYESISRFKSGHQSALPHAVFEKLQRHFDVSHECYASPLNRFPGNPTHCSLFYDVDRFFGSKGSFFDWTPPPQDFAQAFEVNPPYDASSVRDCFRHIQDVLKSDSPLTFIVIVPSHLAESVMPRRDPIVARFEILHKFQHKFQMGMQHRRTGETNSNTAGSTAWVMNHDTAIFFLQNNAARKHKPVRDEEVADVMAGFALTPEDKQHVPVAGSNRTTAWGAGPPRA